MVIILYLIESTNMAQIQLNVRSTKYLKDQNYEFLLAYYDSLFRIANDKK
jgi:hypothetical protein